MSQILSAPLTSLLGREQETATLLNLLTRADVRLVTVSGPGGVGKTSLALQVANGLRDAFHGGVFFISLAPISDPKLIIPTIAQVLGVTETPNRLLLDGLKDFLRDRLTLLVLDNFEQIVSAAPLLMELFSACSELRMLVTSREALRLRGEQEFPLLPLAMDDLGKRSGDRSVDTLMQHPAIALFVQRVQAIQPDFRLTEDNSSTVTEICLRLDGLPLAIELAAARIRLLPPKTILEKLQESSLQLLTSGARDMPARQQTLRSAIQWSYNLLDDEEQRVFRWLSIFLGGCTLDAAQSVIGSPASMDVLASLVGKSLVHQTEMDGAPRLIMLETIREFGMEQLIHLGELESARRQHAAWYVALAEEAEPYLLGKAQKTWRLRLEAEIDNLRAAYLWAIVSRDGNLALHLAGALSPFWFASGRWNEGRSSLDEALDLASRVNTDKVIQAKVLYQAGSLARYQGDFARARQWCEQSLALFRSLGDQPGMVMTLALLSRICNFQQDLVAKNDFMSEAVLLIDSLPDTVEKALAYKDINLTITFNIDPFTEETNRYVDEFERISRAIDFRTDLTPIAILLRAGWVIRSGENVLATSLVDEARSLVEEFNDERLNVRLDINYAKIDMQMGNFDAARLRLHDIIRSAYRRNDHILFMAFVYLAVTLFEQGMPEWSAKVLALADIGINTGPIHPELAHIDHLPFMQGLHSKLRIQLGDEAFAKLLLAGKHLTLDDLDTIPYPATSTRVSVDLLTQRETEVLQLLAQDLSNPQIAEQLVVSRRTVDAHLRSIYDKLGVKSRDAATRVAMERGLIENTATQIGKQYRQVADVH